MPAPPVPGLSHEPDMHVFHIGCCRQVVSTSLTMATVTHHIWCKH